MRIRIRTSKMCLSVGFLVFCGLFLTDSMVSARERKVLQKVSAAPADPQKRAADSWIDQTPGSTGTNHGSDTTLRVTSFLAPLVLIPQNQRTLVEFDLTSIPRSSIKLATLTLFMSTAPTLSRTYQAQRVTGLWNESAISWSNR